MGRATPREVPVRFYRSDAGREPVREWLRGLDDGDRRTIGLDRMRVQFRLAYRDAAGAEFTGRIVGGSLPSPRIARLILCFHDETLIVLHGFIKKTQKTPADDLTLAKRRMNEVTR